MLLSLMYAMVVQVKGLDSPCLVRGVMRVVYSLCVEQRLYLATTRPPNSK